MTCVVCKFDEPNGRLHDGRDSAGQPTRMFVCDDCESWANGEQPWLVQTAGGKTRTTPGGLPPRSGLAFFLRMDAVRTLENQGTVKGVGA